MPGLVLRLLIGALGLWLASVLVPGIVIQGVGTLLLAALLLGMTNALVRPLLILLTLPITVVTLGLFLLVINAAMLGLVAAMLDAFTIAGFFSALFGALIVSLTGWIASWYIGPSGRIEVMVVRSERHL
ncbi:MAG: phage holin family protein [Gammaproteobacteria bacterium]|nr:phage holin family protein [Gammaproteobacteria bacterium]